MFSDLPAEVVIDTSAPTSLQAEYLLNASGSLEVKKVYGCGSAKPKEKVFIVCQHPSADGLDDLLRLKITDLRRRAQDQGIPDDEYDGRVCGSIRHAIWRHADDLQPVETELPTDKEDAKKFFESLKQFFPIYALFQSDRKSTDSDQEVVDPMKVAIDMALGTLAAEIEHIKAQVRQHATETALRTLEKLQEMDSDLAGELVPDFKTDPKLNSLFKLTIKSDDSIPINKRGSGVRRLILLSFFRAEAERRRQETNATSVIFGFEEPETSQHPDHQEMLLRAFLELSESPGCQVLLTTHTPALAGLLPLGCLRYINKSGGAPVVEMGTNDVFEKVADTLGVLPDPVAKTATAILLVEGKDDVIFVKHTATQLKAGGHLPETLEERGFAVVPMGGCGNLKHWVTLRLVEQFGVPYCVLLDSDKGTADEPKRLASISGIQQQGVRAYLTRKRELENYIHKDVLRLAPGSTLNYTDTCDAKVLISREKQIGKRRVLETFWPLMSEQQVRHAEHYQDGGTDHYEFTEMFTDFLGLV